MRRTVLSKRRLWGESMLERNLPIVVAWIALALLCIGALLFTIPAAFGADKPQKLESFVVPARLVIPEEFRKPVQVDPDPDESRQPTAEAIRPIPRVELIVPASSAMTSPSACPIDASVIVSAMGQGGTFICSGTCVDAVNGVSTILTCAHEFRGLTKPEITVTHEKKEFPAKLLRLDDANDLAVLDVNADLPSVELATVKPGVGDTVTSIGISHADTGKLEERSHKITAVDKYSNPRNFETDGSQIVGRSGGGLFSNGQLCGIIQGRRNDVARSIYVSIEPIREILAKSSAVGSSATQRTKVRLWMAPFHCPPCHRLNRALGTGNDRVVVETLVAPKNWNPLEGGFPFVEIFDSVGKSHLIYNVVSMDQLEQNIDRIEDQQSSSEVGSTPVGATIQGRAAIAQFLATIESIGGPECSVEFKWHREGGKDAFLINKMPTRQEFFGTSGRIEISIATTKKVPVHELKFDYRFDDKGKLFVKPDWIEIDIPEDGVVQSGPQPVGSVIMTAWTVMSIAYDIWNLAHPTCDVWIGQDINATAKYANGKLTIDTGSNPPAVRLHWAFMMGLLRFELSRALTGGVIGTERCSIQFHKSRLFRDVNIDVQ